MNTALLSKTLSRLLNQSLVPTPLSQLQQCRTIRAKVRNGKLEQAVGFMGRKMQWSGIERMIKREQLYHIKNSEKWVLAKKRVQIRASSQELACKLQQILIKKVRGL